MQEFVLNFLKTLAEGAPSSGYSSQIEGSSFSVKGYNSVLPSLLPIG